MAKGVDPSLLKLVTKGDLYTSLQISFLVDLGAVDTEPVVLAILTFIREQV